MVFLSRDFLQAPRSGAASDTFADYASFVFNVVSVSLAHLKAPGSSADRSLLQRMQSLHQTQL